MENVEKNSIEKDIRKVPRAILGVQEDRKN